MMAAIRGGDGVRIKVKTVDDAIYALHCRNAPDSFGEVEVGDQKSEVCLNSDYRLLASPSRKQSGAFRHLDC